MTPEFAISLAIFVVLFVLLNRLAPPGRTGYEEDPELEIARRAIKSKIDEHAETLARRYQEICAEDTCRDPLPGFAREIEGFIGSILLHDIEVDHPGLGPAVREVVTLEREHVYEQVLARVRTP